jgi:hypothetical protein
MPLASAARDERGLSRIETIENVRGLLAKALEIVDVLNLPPEIGARLHEVIIAVDSE